ncbi:MAG: MurR/RpiR family transcriptional regulator [Velocimicrobium sp.]
MLIEKLQRGIDFTNHEKLLAEYILKHPDTFQQMNCEELGKATFTSKSTVVRLCKKLSVTGYQELKKILFFEWKENETVKTCKHAMMINESSTCRDIIDKLPEIYKELMEEVNLYNSSNLFTRILNRMSKMNQIDFYGTGFGYTLLEGVSQKLNTLGIEGKAYNTLNERYLVANCKKIKILAFVMTFSGNNPLAIHEAEVLKRLGVYVVGIVGPLADEILKNCDEVIRLPLKAMQSGMDGILINQCISYIMDIFVAGMLVNDYEQIMSQEHIINFDYDKEVSFDTKVSKMSNILKK